MSPQSLRRLVPLTSIVLSLLLCSCGASEAEPAKGSGGELGINLSSGGGGGEGNSSGGAESSGGATSEGSGGSGQLVGPDECDRDFYCDGNCLHRGESGGNCTNVPVDVGFEFIEDALIHEGTLYLSLSNRVATLPLEGGVATDLVPDHGVSDFTVGGDWLFYSVYGSDTSNLYRRPLSGGEAELIYSGVDAPRGLEFAGGRLFFVLGLTGYTSVERAVMSLLPDGSDLRTHGSDFSGGIERIVATDDSVFWFQAAGLLDDSLVSSAHDESEPTAISSEEFGELLTLYDDQLYWVAENELLRTMPLSGGEPSTWSDVDNGGYTRELLGTERGLVAKFYDKVWKFPWDGGAAVEIATVPLNMQGFVSDGKDVFYIGLESITRISVP